MPTTEDMVRARLKTTGIKVRYCPFLRLRVLLPHTL